MRRLKPGLGESEMPDLFEYADEPLFEYEDESAPKGKYISEAAIPKGPEQLKKVLSDPSWRKIAMQQLGQLGLGVIDPSMKFGTRLAEMIPGTGPVVSIANLLSKKLTGEELTEPHGKGPVYNVGKFLGEALPMMLPVGAATTGIRALGLGGKFIPEILGQTLGTGAYEAVTHPENRLGAMKKGMIAGASVPTALSVADFGLRHTPLGVGTVYKSLREAMASPIARKTTLGIAGGRTVPEARESLKSYVTSAQKEVQGATESMYSKVMKPEGKKRVFGQLDQITGLADPEQARLLPARFKSSSVYKEAKDNPTIENLHRLQSDMAREGHRRLSVAKPGYEEDIANQMIDVADNIKNNLKNNLSPEGKTAYEAADEFYKSNLRPFYDSPGIQKLIQGEPIDKGTLWKLFEFPGIGKETGKNWKINQIREHLQKDALEDILKLQLGGSMEIGPKELVKKAGEAAEAGFGEFMPKKFTRGVAMTERFLPPSGKAQTFSQRMGIPSPQSIYEKVFKNALTALLSG